MPRGFSIFNMVFGLGEDCCFSLGFLFSDADLRLQWRKGRAPAKGAPMPKSEHGCRTGKIRVEIMYLSEPMQVVFIEVKTYTEAL